MESQSQHQIQYLNQPEELAQPAFLIHDQLGNVVECHFPDRLLKVVQPGYHNGVVTSPGGVLEFLADGKIMFHVTPVETTYKTAQAPYREVDCTKLPPSFHSDAWAEQDNTRVQIQPRHTYEPLPGPQPSTTGTQGFSIYATADLSKHLFGHEYNCYY